MGGTWTIQEVAKAAGTTSRALRYYDEIGLLRPSQIAPNGYRLYNTSALIRLQRILALRDLGMGLGHISAVLDRDRTEIEALTDLEQQLLLKSARLERQIASVRRTLETLMKGAAPMADDMFDGFDHSQHKDEVEERWGNTTWQHSSDWWNALGRDEQHTFMQTVKTLNADWQQAAADGVLAESDVAQALAARHLEWLNSMPAPYDGQAVSAEYVRNLATMYVEDPRFAVNYGGEAGAALVRDALNIYADTHLQGF